jgi:preprotein translocase subunit SecF
MFVVKYKKIFFILTAVIVAVSIFFIVYDGLNLAIDFTGGSVLEVRLADDLGKESIEEALSSIEGSTFIVRSLEDGGYNIRSQSLGEEERSLALEALTFGGEVSVQEEKFSSIGPVISRELGKKAIYALLVASIGIIFFIAFSFRKVSKPVSSWIYGLTAIVALGHDIIVPTGLFALLGVVAGAQIDLLFIVALLTILGYSVNDTIIVFDRVRENLKIDQEKGSKTAFREIVGKSLNQTFMRSINTSSTTLLVLIALYFIGGEVTKNFSLVLMIGVIAGTYSSIFLACPLLVWVEEKLLRKSKRA